MARIRLRLSIDRSDYDCLVSEAEKRRMLPARLASAILTDWVAGHSTAHAAPQDAVHLLLDWVSGLVDAIREDGTWDSKVTMSVFEKIESEAIILYRAAEGQVGRKTVNQMVGRTVRVGLGAEVMKADGRPLVWYVPKGGTKLAKSVTRLRAQRDA